MISISQHFMAENANPWLGWNPESLPTAKDQIKEFLRHEESLIVDLVAKGHVSKDCLPYDVSNFAAVAFAFKYSEHKGWVDHVFFYGDEPNKINLGSLLGEVEIIHGDLSDEIECNYANVGAMFSYGLTLIGEGNEELAETYLRKAMNFPGEDQYDQVLYAHDALGVLLANQGRLSEAVDIWIQGFKLFEADEFVGRLNQVIKSGKDLEAVQKAKKALGS